jgi:hypothetical protein
MDSEKINSKNNINLIFFIIGLIFIFHIYWKLQTTECMADISNPTKLNLTGSIVVNNNINHPDSGNSIYKAEDYLTMAANNIIKFRSSTNKANNIEMDVSAGNVKSNILSVANNNITHPDKDSSVYMSDGSLTIANVSDTGFINFRSIADKTNNIWMNTKIGNIQSKALVVSDDLDDGGKITLQNKNKTKDGQVRNWDILNNNSNNKLIFRGNYVNGTNTGSTLEILDNGLINIASSFYVKKNNFLFYPEDAIIYDNIFDAYNNADGSLVKSGNPTGWNDTQFKTTPWTPNVPNSSSKLMLNIGNINNTEPNGALITVPSGKNVIWVRIINYENDTITRWNTYKVYEIQPYVVTTLNRGVASYKTYTRNALIRSHSSGYRKLTSISPDGGCADVHHEQHKWMFMPVKGPGKYIICSGSDHNDNDCWISGLAFTTNPWNWIMNPIVNYHWKLNGNTADITWENSNWNNDMLGYFKASSSNTISVPNIKSGKDRLLYFIEHNNVNDGGSHGKIKIINQEIGRLRSTWDHPLARHYNSKPYNRFLATIVPDALSTADFINVTIEIKFNNFYVREIGTIDLY